MRQGSGNDSLGHVEFCVDLLVLGPLGDKEGVSRCSLADRRVKTDDELDVEVVHFWQEE